ATNSAGYRKPATAEAPLTSSDADSWEPPDEVKGDVARALFYMAVRYTGDPTNEPALYLTDNLPQITSTTNLMGRLTTLFLWNRLDPVDAAERHRNDLVYQLYQHNRNPFVDHPELVEAAFLPTLSIRANGTNVFLEWPPEYSGAVVETRSDFQTPWTASLPPGTLVSNHWQVILPAHTSANFHRLRLK
ncbi:MAG TPA: endonuclease, partial [Tepidisphaeraceae bacterium]|nr:endonuclease [Tepidisphaeraceae bacterium]